LLAGYEVVSAEIAAGVRPCGRTTRRCSQQKPRFLLAGYEVMSAEIAAGDFSQ
jgi:hypothetical protein